MANSDQCQRPSRLLPTHQHVATQTENPSCCSAVIRQLQAVEEELLWTRARLQKALGSRPAVLAAACPTPAAAWHSCVQSADPEYEKYEPLLTDVQKATTAGDSDATSFKGDCHKDPGSNSHQPADCRSVCSSVELCLSDIEEQPQPASAVNPRPATKLPEDVGEVQPFDVVLVESDSDVDVCLDSDNEEQRPQPCVVQTWTCQEEPSPACSSPEEQVESTQTGLSAGAEFADCGPVPEWLQPAVSEEQDTDIGEKMYVERTANEGMDFPTFHVPGTNKWAEASKAGEALDSEDGFLTAVKQEPEGSDHAFDAEGSEPAMEFVASDYHSDLSADESRYSDLVKKKKHQYSSKTTGRPSVASSCWQCTAHFPSIHELQRHTAAEHPGTGAHLCSQCSKSFSTASTLQQHARFVHLKEKPHACKTCSTTFTKKTSLLMHQWREHGTHRSDGVAMPRTWTRRCPCCFKVFSTDANTRRHFCHAHLNEKTFTCEACGEGFMDRSKLLTHRQTHKKRNIELELLQLQEQKPEQNQLKAFPAGKSNGSGSEHCPHCGKGFCSAGNVRRHIRETHLKQRPYRCETCGLAFSQNSTLKEHRLLHTSDDLPTNIQQQPFWCGMCGRTFQTTRNLQIHMKTHDDSTVFPCLICKKTFTKYTNLKRHIAMAHKRRRIKFSKVAVETVSQGPADPTTAVFSCRHCGKLFNSKQVLYRHIATHTNLAPEETATVAGLPKMWKSKKIQLANMHSCSQCGSQFTTVTKLQKHSFVHSEARRHCCSICGWRFTLKCHLKIHMRRHCLQSEPSQPTDDGSVSASSQEPQSASAVHIVPNTMPSEGSGVMQPFQTVLVKPDSDVDVCVDSDEERPQPRVDQTWTCQEEPTRTCSSPDEHVEKSTETGLSLATEPGDIKRLQIC